MDPVIVGVIGFLVLFALLMLLELPIAVGMGIVGFAGLWYLTSGTAALTKLATTPFNIASDYNLATLPLFLLMAGITFASGIIGDLFNLAAKLVGRLPGGMAMATILACAGFSAVSSSSVATAAIMGTITIPEMKRHKYASSLYCGAVAAGGTLGILIPPSGILIIYGIITETSIGKLFMAGVIPGLLLALLFCLVILGQCLWKPAMGPPGPKASFKETMTALGNSAEIIGLIILVFGGLQIGWFTPTEAGAVAAVGAILFSLIRNKLNFKKFVLGLKDTMKTTGMVYAMIIGAFIYSNFVAVSNIPFELTNWVSGLAISPIAVIFVIIVIYVFLGCLMDGGGMMVLTIPIFFPIVMNLGFDPVWFGIMTVIVLEMGMITPPVGMNVFIIFSIAKDVPMYTVFKGIAPFFLCQAALAVLIIFVPNIALFLPNLMKF